MFVEHDCAYGSQLDFSYHCFRDQIQVVSCDKNLSTEPSCIYLLFSLLIYNTLIAF